MWCASDNKCYQKSLIDQSGCTNKKETSESCVIPFDLTTSQVAGISAGIIAAIVIGIVVCVALTSLAGKKGYDVWLRNQKKLEGAQTNPLYMDEGRTGVNPMAE